MAALNLKRDGLSIAAQGQSPLQYPPVPLQDYAGRCAQVGSFGDQIHACRLDDVRASFGYGVPAEVTTSTSGLGGAAAASGLMTLSSGAGVGASSMVSNRKIRYRAGHDGWALFTAKFTGTVASDGYLRAGLYDADDGWFVGMNGASGFGVTSRKSASDTFIPQNEFLIDPLNGDGPSGFNLDTAKLKAYRISYGFLGVVPPIFEVYGGPRYGWIPFHYQNTDNMVAPHVIVPSFPIMFEASKTGTGSNITVSTASIAGGTIGAPLDWTDLGRKGVVENTKSISSSTLTNIVSLRNVSTFNTITNHVESVLLGLSTACEGTKTTAIKIYKGATLAGSPSWSAVSANSVLEKDTAGTTVSGGTLVGTFKLGKSSSEFVDTRGLEISMLPGEALTFAALSTGASDVDIGVFFADLF